VERVPALLERAREAIAASGVRNVSLLGGDGSLGWPAHAPYDAIAVGAGAPVVPEPLKAQLAEGGRLVIPVGRDETQSLRLIVRAGDTFEEQDLGPVRFVPLVGEHGWAG
jgi:protein-L-isoaspartate(D-aspartate) O-methyltransferase